MSAKHTVNARSEKRAEKRVNVPFGGTLTYRSADPDGNNGIHLSQLVNLSEKGAKVLCHQPVAVGAKLNASIRLNDAKVITEMPSRVSWCLELDQVPTYQLGLVFLIGECKQEKRWRKQFNQFYERTALQQSDTRSAIE